MTDIDRRAFLAGLSVASGLTIVPRRVLGGQGYIAPSDMVRAGAGRLRYPGAAADQHGVASAPTSSSWPSSIPIATARLCRLERVGQPQSDPPVPRRAAVGRERSKGIRGGREVAKEIMETYYRKQNRPGGIRAYEDYREMLEKERDIQGVVNITPDHQHGSINIAALRKGKAAISHKPVASVAARGAAHACRRHATAVPCRTCSPTATMPDRHTLAAWINGGVVGAVREVHNWTNRPFWPQGMQAYHPAGAARTGWLQLGAVAGSRAGAALHPELHLRRVSRLVRLWNRLPRRHGALQPVAAVPHPRTRRTGVGRGRPSNDAWVNETA